MQFYKHKRMEICLCNDIDFPSKNYEQNNRLFPHSLLYLTLYVSHPQHGPILKVSNA